MKGRLIVLGAALGIAVALTFGFAHGSGGTMPAGGQGESGQTVSMSEMWSTMDAMHDSAAMQQIHAQMPAELRAQCEAMHEQMSQMMGSMSGVSGMGGIPGGMSAGMGGMTGGLGSHAAHHPTTGS